MLSIYLVSGLCAIACLPVGAAEQDIHVIGLHHREATDMVALIKPLLAAGDGVSGSGNRLIVKSSAETFLQIRNLVDQLDREPGQFLVSMRVIDGSRDQVRRRDLGAGINHSRDNGESSTGLKLNARLTTSESARGYSTIEQLRVMEGGTASFYIQDSRSGDVYPGNPAISGFSVQPRMSGEHRVTLKVAPIHSRGQETLARTTFVADTGHWVEIAGVDTSDKHEGSRLWSTRSRDSNGARHIEVKVELIP